MSYESHGWLVDASRVCRSDYILRCRLSRLCRVPLALPGVASARVNYGEIFFAASSILRLNSVLRSSLTHSWVSL
jgi:hypothetical protein